MKNPFSFLRGKSVASRRKPAASGGGLFHAIRAHFAAALAAARTRFSLPESEIAAILSASVAD